MIQFNAKNKRYLQASWIVAGYNGEP